MKNSLTFGFLALFLVGCGGDPSEDSVQIHGRTTAYSEEEFYPYKEVCIGLMPNSTEEEIELAWLQVVLNSNAILESCVADWRVNNDICYADYNVNINFYTGLYCYD